MHLQTRLCREWNVLEILHHQQSNSPVYYSVCVCLYAEMTSNRFVKNVSFFFLKVFDFSSPTSYVGGYEKATAVKRLVCESPHYNMALEWIHISRARGSDDVIELLKGNRLLTSNHAVRKSLVGGADPIKTPRDCGTSSPIWLCVPISISNHIACRPNYGSWETD